MRAGGSTRGEPSAIAIRGARVHNLRDVDVDIPRGRLVVITGLSGSGKSSLAFDTLYAEGQRRYVESLSAYARQFLDQLARPEVESITGLSPSIAIEQATVSRSPRSTVGTATELLDHLRLLFARVGVAHCHRCGKPISSQTLEQMTARVLALGDGARVTLLAPIVRGKKGERKQELAELAEKGFVRARIDGELRDLASEIKLAKTRAHTIEAVVDRVVVRESARARIAESLATALGLGGGACTLAWETARGPEEALLSQTSACPDCGVSYPALEPRHFSFNGAAGACRACSGLGTASELDPEKIVPDPARALGSAIAPWGGGRAARYYVQLLEGVAAHLGVTLETPWNELPKSAQSLVLSGAGERELEFKHGKRGLRRVKRKFDGVLGELARRIAAGDVSDEERARYTREAPCSECGGARLGVVGRNVRVDGRTLPELAARPISETRAWLGALALGVNQRAIAERILEEIREQLKFLCDVGLDYLSLDRPTATLSGGEAQRIRLATQVGAHLMGVLYVLDEPSIGLHPRDHARLLASLEKLRDAGNSVVVVEHDEETIRRADWVIDMGPGAGVHGGRIVAQGTPAAIMDDAASLTGAYLSGKRSIRAPQRRPLAGAPRLVLSGCRANNLRDLRFELPLGRFTVVTGVSGSGKSTLVNDTLHRALAKRLHRAAAEPGAHESLTGAEALERVVDVDQAPIGRTPRSNPATYTGVFDGIRALFAAVPEARARGYGPGRFSFNVKGGRCESCQGDGSLRVEMHFLPDLFVPCEVCGARRYNRETLEIRYKGKTIAEVLESSIEEAVTFFENVPKLRRPLETLRDVGLGYLHLGQPATTLSGGEAQRVKLSRELSRRGDGKTLYLLDEPTTGLHFADIERLLDVLQRLVERGNTVLVIEHQLDVIKVADYVVDLGPESGAGGGRIVAAGTPEEVARSAESHTGRALAASLR
ncbi:MAG: excinuclease ABC subunit UvrA [Myxococcota bacterium]|jgi:excinuclease ABC subunit A